MTETEASEENLLAELRALLTQLRPLLESRLVVMSQEYQLLLLPRITYALAKQRHRDLCKVLDESPPLEVALRLCAPLAIDVDALLEREPQQQTLIQQFYDLYARRGYHKIGGLLQRRP